MEGPLATHSRTLDVQKTKEDGEMIIRNIVLGILVLAGLVLIIYPMGRLVFPVSERTYEIWLPEKCEIWPTEKVRTGTFRLDLDMKEFQARTQGKNVLVVYGQEFNRARGAMGKIEYWHPREDGTFYYAQYETPWTCLFNDLETSISKENNTITCKPGGVNLCFSMSICLGVVVLLVTLGVIIAKIEKDGKTD